MSNIFHNTTSSKHPELLALAIDISGRQRSRSHLNARNTPLKWAIKKLCKTFYHEALNEQKVSSIESQSFRIIDYYIIYMVGDTLASLSGAFYTASPLSPQPGSDTGVNILPAGILPVYADDLWKRA